MKCSNCRKTIFEAINILRHDPGKGSTEFQYRKRGNSFKQVIECTHIFLDFTPLHSELTKGRIDCVHCNAKLGNFDLSGMQCSCGKWIAPAFALANSKVDLI
jgi:dual specificity phosphatase 12